MSDPKFILCHIYKGTEIYINACNITAFYQDPKSKATVVYTIGDSESFFLAETLPEFRRLLSDALC